jgi:chromosome segregation ATPase
MLEEAAGITKYKRKKEESQRKIEGARPTSSGWRTSWGKWKTDAIAQEAGCQGQTVQSLGEEIQRLELILNAHAYEELKEESGKQE